MGLSDEELQTIYLGRAIVASVSFICSTVILIFYFSFKELQFFFMRLIMFLIFSDAIHSLCMTFPSDNEVSCYVQAVLLEFSSSSRAIWALMICIALYVGIVNQDRRVEERTLYFMLGGYGLPVILTAIPAIFDSYGQAGGWCWITLDEDFLVGSILRLACFYAPLTIVIICCLVLYSLIAKAIKEHLEGLEDAGGSQDEIIKRIMIFPMILIICYAPIYTLRILDFIYQDSISYILSLASILCTLCAGIFNAIAYGLNGNVKEAIKGFCKRRFQRSSSVSLAEGFSSRYSEIHSTF